eukprot:gene11310-12321_t
MNSERLQDLFQDPLNFELMRNPVMNDCGHTFDNESIVGYIGYCHDQGRQLSCPLCTAHLRLPLRPNILVKQAIDVLTNPENAGLGQEQMTDEEIETIENGVNHIEQIRSQNAANNIPNVVPERMTFAENAKAIGLKVSQDIAQFYGCF